MNELIQELDDIGPWHAEVPLGNGMTTGLTNQKIYWNPIKHQENPFHYMTPESCLDMGCNCGYQSFKAHELGVKDIHGCDAKELWITQANYLKNKLNINDINFQLLNLRDAERYYDRSFDMIILGGILYHDENPIRLLLWSGRKAKRHIFISTVINTNYENGWHCEYENDHPLHGIDGMKWFPSSIDEIQTILKHTGFKKFEGGIITDSGYGEGYKRVNIWAFK